MNQKTVCKISIFIFLVSLAATSYGGMSRSEAVKLKPKSDNDALLFAERFDPVLATLKHKVVFYLNDVKVLEPNKYHAVPLHLRPGKYNIRWEIYNKKGEQIKRYEYMAELQAGKVHETAVQFNFAWICSKKARVMKPQIFFLDLKFHDEMDLRNKIKPL